MKYSITCIFSTFVILTLFFYVSSISLSSITNKFINYGNCSTNNLYNFFFICFIEGCILSVPLILLIVVVGAIIFFIRKKGNEYNYSSDEYFLKSTSSSDEEILTHGYNVQYDKWIDTSF